MADKFDSTPDLRTAEQKAESLAYKLAVVDRLAEAMRDKFREKEPRRDWRDGTLSLADTLKWLLEEVVEMISAEPWEVRREAADVANLAAIYSDLVERTVAIGISAHLKMTPEEIRLSKFGPGPIASIARVQEIEKAIRTTIAETNERYRRILEAKREKAP